MQSLQRLVCAVEVARMTVVAPISNVVRDSYASLFLTSFSSFFFVHCSKSKICNNVFAD